MQYSIYSSSKLLYRNNNLCLNMILGYNSYPYLISNHSSTNHHTTDSSAQYLTLIRPVSGIMHRWVPELNWSLPHAHMCVCVSVCSYVPRTRHLTVTGPSGVHWDWLHVKCMVCVMCSNEQHLQASDWGNIMKLRYISYSSWDHVKGRGFVQISITI